MIRFDSDYIEGAHESILKRLSETNNEQLPGYGTDHHTETAKAYIRDLCGVDADVHFMVGGTQANMTIIASMLRTHQGVIAPDSGHIAGHETGAIESVGHKVLEIENSDGKINAEQVRSFAEGHWNDPTHEHMPQPKMVYISQPTESGTLYSRQELEDLREICTENNLYLMVDGARLGYALASRDNDTSIRDLASLCDVFYIGGTKVGALFGEAIVITNDNIKPDFRYIMKQKGGLLAKGRLLGIQFEVLFENGLYFEISKHAIEMAHRLAEAFEKKAIEMYAPASTNQIFPILTDTQIDVLQSKYAFHVWEEIDTARKAIRLCTSWSTTSDDVDALISDIEKL
ncbi:threonine aldolase family protein [Salinicoccus hispanicus]|uniref:Aminotransferase class I/II-fold pyridoxal phosphate-dependent enzyme n=1 Tax=Salinicoccus hispanicus TaxID=157225 RepID=A0A6N8U1V6_9STAP|nr:low specificity L-threonine aldolase [Salinicoccus hispanicus]MXQ50345.1 aminotransferase class I/II-fold pyridoxal phosphate-dependent enzyme [Salinicoccus hispanicus]